MVPLRLLRQVKAILYAKILFVLRQTARKTAFFIISTKFHHRA